jgi:hypothetical protein
MPHLVPQQSLTSRGIPRCEVLKVQPVNAIDQILREAARGFTHLVKWVDYHSGAGTQPSSCSARLTVYSTCPAGDDAVEGLDLLEEAA